MRYTKIVLVSIFLLSAFILGIFLGNKIEKKDIIRSLIELEHESYERYSIENLKNFQKTGTLEIGDLVNEFENFNSYTFSFTFEPDPASSELKTTTGLINIPKEKSHYPLVLMLRGYVNQETFKSGDGTRNVSYKLAENGFITIAPDFLGYGESDPEAGNIFETRFQTYTTVLSIINYLEKNINIKLGNENWKLENIFLWSHSNGGHIAITTLEITGKNYPTTLWAPVSKPFPYSVLYYTDQSEDGGVLIRSELSKFESANNPDSFSLTNNLENIKAPLQIQQGEDDEAVPKSWSDEIVSKLKSAKIDVTYNIYPLTDHNMNPRWREAVERDLEFFRKHIDN